MNDLEIFPQKNISRHLLKHQEEMLRFLFFTQYDIILQSFQLKHAAYMSSTKRGYPVQQFNKNDEIQRHFGMISQKLHMRFMRQDMALDRMLQNLQIFWQNKNVPLFHRYYFEKYVHSAHIKCVIELMQRQLKLVRDQKHHFYLITNTIKAREACLRQLKKQVADLKVEDIEEYFHYGKERWLNEKGKNEHYNLQQKGYILKSTNSTKKIFQQTVSQKSKLQIFSDTFSHLSKLTLYCIQEILNWKNYIYHLTHDPKKKRQRLEYFYFEQNYFLKILSDTTFLNVSILKEYFKFAQKNDPFQLYPIISIENNSSKNLHSELLKQIFMPLPQNLPEILNKIEILSTEYMWNVKSRKNYDFNLLKIPSLTQTSQVEKSNIKALSPTKKIQHQKQHKNLASNRYYQKKEPISNIVLKKIEQSPRRTKSLKTFRVRSQTKTKNIVQSGSRDKILIESKISPKKKVNWLPGVTLKTIKQTVISPLKNSVILQRNKINPLSHLKVSDDLLKSLKKEVIRKIKHQFQTNSASQDNTSKDQALDMYISSKINQAIKGIFPFEPQKHLKSPIQLSAIRNNQQSLDQQISLIVKHSLELYKEMQLKQAEIRKQLSQVPFVYFLKATEGQNYLGTVVISIDTEVKQHKTLKTLFIGFNQKENLEMLIIETTKFLQKYENAFEVHFPFFLPLNNEPIQQLLDNLQKVLLIESEKNNLKCVVAQKQIYSNMKQTRFMFKRQEENVNFYPNLYPTSFHFKISLIHSEKKLFLERSKFQKQHGRKISYDLLLSQILSKKFDGDQMKLVKEKCLNEVRYNELIRMIQGLDEGKNTQGITEQNDIRYIQSNSVYELNKRQAKQKQSYPYMELSDTVKTGNHIQYVSMQKIFKLPYEEIKAILGKNNQSLYRITINEQVPVRIYKNTLFYRFRLEEDKNKNIDETGINKPSYLNSQNDRKQNDQLNNLILFSAQQYLESQQPELSTYLIEALFNSKQQQRNVFINELWIPMLRYPQDYSQKQDLFVTTHPINDLKQLKTHLYVGQFIQWFCHLSIPNSINYNLPSQQYKKGQIQFKKPLGIAVISYFYKKPILSYAKIFTDD